MTSQKQLLAILLGLLMLSLVYAWQRFPRQQTAPPLAKTAQLQPPSPAGAAAPHRAASEAPDLPGSQGVIVRRDLFRSLESYQTATTRQRAPVQPVVAPPLEVPLPAPPSPAEIAQNEARQFRAMGFLKRDGKQVAFVARGERISVVREGDSLITGYKIASINNYRIVMRAEDGDEITITGR